MPDQPRPSARIVAEPRWDVYYAVVLAACLAIVDAAPVPVSQRIIATAFISEATVKTHLLRAFGKLGVSGRTAAVTTAIERGLLPPPGRNR